MDKTELEIPNMICSRCEDAVAQALLVLDGVRVVHADAETGRAHIEYDGGRIDAGALRATLAGVALPVGPGATRDDRPAVLSPINAPSPADR